MFKTFISKLTSFYELQYCAKVSFAKVLSETNLFLLNVSSSSRKNQPTKWTNVSPANSGSQYESINDSRGSRQHVATLTRTSNTKFHFS
jgi:hypothetical protein